MTDGVVPILMSILTLIAPLGTQSVSSAGSWVGMVVNIPRQRFFNPLIIINGESVNVTVQYPSYMFYHYGVLPITYLKYQRRFISMVVGTP